MYGAVPFLVRLVTGGWRVFFDLSGELNEDAELRALLLSRNQTISETWVYRYQMP